MMRTLELSVNVQTFAVFVRDVQIKRPFLQIVAIIFDPHWVTQTCGVEKNVNFSYTGCP